MKSYKAACQNIVSNRVMCVCAYMCVYKYTHVYKYACTGVHVCICMYVPAYTYIEVFAPICMCAYVCADLGEAQRKIPGSVYVKRNV